MHREVPICLRRLQLPTRIQKTKAQFLNSPVPRCQIRGGSLTTRARTELGVGESGVGGFHPPSCYKFMCTRERFSSTDQMIECDLYMRKSLKGGGKIYPPPDSRNPNSVRAWIDLHAMPKNQAHTEAGLRPQPSCENCAYCLDNM